jgi:Fe-S cluster assembly iron-binding protein IscA
MLEVSELASTKLKAYLAENNIESAIRVAVMQGG